MRELRSPGSVRGALSNGGSYRDKPRHSLNLNFFVKVDIGGDMETLLNENIDRYCNHFSRQIVRVNEVSDEEGGLFRKILLSSILDAMSRSVCPPGGNRKGFTFLVKNFGDWPDHNRVSLPHLEKLLKDNTDTAFKKLREITATRLKEWKHPMNTIPLDRDPVLDEIVGYWLFQSSRCHMKKP